MSLKKNNKSIKIPDYFSDDEADVEEEQDDDTMLNNNYGEYEETDEEMDEEMDEETRRIIFESTSRNIDRFTNDLNELCEKGKKEREDKKKSQQLKKETKNEKKGKQIFNLVDFNKKVEEDSKANQPKKFISKRADDRRKQLGISSDNNIKRSFNPRKPPYNFVKSHDRKEVVLDLINTNDFPSL